MAHPVTWFQISGNDASGLQNFYKKLFAWKLSPSPDGSMMMVAPEKGGISGGIGPSPDGKPSVAVYANVDDIAAHLKKAQDAGATVAMPPMELPQGMGWIAGFTDPVGNFMGLWQPGKPAPRPRKKASAKKAAVKKAPAKKAAVKKAPAKKKAGKKKK